MNDITPKEAIANLNHLYGMVAPDIQRSLDVAIKALERPQGKWIPVSERLPEEETDVLVCNGKGEMIVCRGSRSTEIKGEFIWYVCDWRYGNVTHWKPLPKAPESETESLDYQRAVEDTEYCERHEPTYNPDDGSM